MIVSKATICLQMIAKRNQQFTNRGDFVKKILICLILLLTCVLLLAGCGASEETTVASTTADTTTPESTTPKNPSVTIPESTTVKKELAKSPTFSEALKQNGFVARDSHEDIDKRLLQWTHNGKSLSEYEGPLLGDGPFGGMTHYWGDGVFQWNVETQWNVDESVVDFTNRLWMISPIDGVAMPYGVGFDHTLAELLKVLGVEADLSSDGEMLLEHILIPDYESKLLLTCHTNTDGGARSYSLTFSEYTEAIWELNDGERQVHALITGSVVLEFASGTNRLKAVSFEIKEKRVYNEDALIDPQTFSLALDRNGFIPGAADYHFYDLLLYCAYEGNSLERFIEGRAENDYGYSTTIKSNDVVFGSSTYQVAGERNDERYDTSLTFHLPVTGLVMPYGVSFGNQLNDVLAILAPLYESWVEGENAWTMTLDHTVKDGYESKLVWIDYSRTSNASIASSTLVFTEIYQATHDDGQVFDVTRSVRVGFGAETGMNEITFSILEVADTVE